MSSTYRAVEVTGVRRFEFVEKELREPHLDEVRIRVLSCGVCHSDSKSAPSEGSLPVMLVN